MFYTFVSVLVPTLVTYCFLQWLERISSEMVSWNLFYGPRDGNMGNRKNEEKNDVELVKQSLSVHLPPNIAKVVLGYFHWEIPEYWLPLHELFVENIGYTGKCGKSVHNLDEHETMIGTHPDNENIYVLLYRVVECKQSAWKPIFKFNYPVDDEESFWKEYFIIMKCWGSDNEIFKSFVVDNVREERWERLMMDYSNNPKLTRYKLLSYEMFCI